MKLAASTLGCPDWSFEKILGMYQKLGLEGIEIRGIEGEMDADKIEAFKPENAKDTLDRVKAHGCRLIGFGTSCSFHDLKNRDAALQQGRISMDVCARMKIPAIRVFGDAFPEEYGREAVLKSVKAALRELTEYGAARGVAVYQEIHGSFNTIEVLAPIVEEMKNVPNFGILWDIEHSDRAYGDGVEPFYRLIAPYVRHVHVKDYVRAKNGKPFQLCMVGEGEIPIPKLVGWLKEDGYDGYLSFEWEKKWVPQLPEADIAFPAFAQYMKALL